MVWAVVGGLYCSCVQVAVESLCLCGVVVSADEVRWVCVREKVLVCTSRKICLWYEVDCDCVKE